MSISLDQWLWAGSLALTGIWVGTLYDAVQWSDADWDRAGLRKLPWFLILVLLSVVGSALYFLRARPRLEKVERRT